MKIGVTLPTVGPVGKRRYLEMVARAADELGFDSVWISSHVALPAERHSTCLYPRATTADAYNWGVAWLDPIVVMGFVAAVTERIRIGTHVLAIPYRQPVILAGELAALDQLSLGRVILGAGLGWMDEEFAAVGISRRERGRRTDEAIGLMRALWTAQAPTTWSGRYFQVNEMWLTSRPFSATGPPVYVGGNTVPALQRVARLGEGWLGHEVYPDEVVAARRQIETLCAASGRDPSDIVISARRGLIPPFPIMNFMSDRKNIAGSAEQIAQVIHDYEQAGTDLLVLDLNMRPSEIVETLHWVASSVRPLMGQPALAVL